MLFASAHLTWRSKKSNFHQKNNNIPDQPWVVRGAVNVDYQLYTWIPPISSSWLRICQVKNWKIYNEAFRFFFRTFNFFPWSRSWIIKQKKLSLFRYDTWFKCGFWRRSRFWKPNLDNHYSYRDRCVLNFLNLKYKTYKKNRHTLRRYISESFKICKMKFKSHIQCKLLYPLPESDLRNIKSF